MTVPTGNLWEKGYALAKQDERLVGATDDI